VNDLRKEIDTLIEAVVEAVRKNRRFPASSLLGCRIHDGGEGLLIDSVTKDAPVEVNEFCQESVLMGDLTARDGDRRAVPRPTPFASA
jgi:hypothetical protein